MFPAAHSFICALFSLLFAGVWVHTTGLYTPQFNASGLVIGPGPNLTRDLQDFVHEAYRRNILVTLTLWNCASLGPGLNLNYLILPVTVTGGKGKIRVVFIHLYVCY